MFFDATSRRRTEYNAGPNEQQVQKPGEIISYSTPESDFGTADQARTTSLNSFAPVEEGLLHNLLSRYPRGKLWTFDRGTCSLIGFGSMYTHSSSQYMSQE